MTDGHSPPLIDPEWYRRHGFVAPDILADGPEIAFSPEPSLDVDAPETDAEKILLLADLFDAWDDVRGVDPDPDSREVQFDLRAIAVRLAELEALNAAKTELLNDVLRVGVNQAKDRIWASSISYNGSVELPERFAWLWDGMK